MKHLATETTEQEAVRSFVARYCRVPRARVRLALQPLDGGLESVTVMRAQAHVATNQAAPRSLVFVVKHLRGDPSREAAIYQELIEPRIHWAAPALLGVEYLNDRDEHGDQQSCRLYLEWVRQTQEWPWTQPRYIQRVLERLARLHALPHAPRPDDPDVPDLDDARGVLAGWDYEAELMAAARSALRVLEQTTHRDFARVRRSLPALRRVVAALPAMRRRLLGFAPLGTAILHGDVHSGNVLLRHDGGQPSNGTGSRIGNRAGEHGARGASQAQPLFIDWGRARIGSPLEDVSSWLQSLGYWEPQARRRHDTLLAAYLAARGLRPRLSRALRDTYWLAGASNILAGALVHYLDAAVHARDPGERQAALHAAEDGLRIVRRADVCWRRAHDACWPRVDARTSFTGGTERTERTELRGERDDADRRRPQSCPSDPPSGSRSSWRWQAGSSSTEQG